MNVGLSDVNRKNTVSNYQAKNNSLQQGASQSRLPQSKSVKFNKFLTLVTKCESSLRDQLRAVEVK